MTKTIEEVKAAKRELEFKISQMVNEFAEEYDLVIVVSASAVRSIGGLCNIEIKL